MQLPAQLFKRKKNSHKGDFGHIFIVAGSAGMAGAAILAGKAALRSGAGLVTIGLSKSLAVAVTKKTAELMTLPLSETKDGSLSLLGFKKIKDFLNKVDVLLIGPGLSKNKETQKLIRKIILQSRIQTVIDADAINAWQGFMEKFKVGVSCLPLSNGRLRIITPHPGEMARILDTTTKEVQERRKEIAKSFANEYNLIVVLKGYKTVVADPNGSIYINKTGNSGMSTAGSGDVLVGIISAFLAQGLNSFEAVKYGVYIHGLAGDLAAKKKTQLGLIASDIIEFIPQAIKKSK